MLQFDKEAITSMCKCLANKMYHTVLGIAKKKKKKKKKSDIKSPFGLGFLITQFSVSITHNSKMVGSIAKSLFGKQ